MGKTVTVTILHTDEDGSTKEYKYEADAIALSLVNEDDAKKGYECNSIVMRYANEIAVLTGVKQLHKIIQAQMEPPVDLIDSLLKHLLKPMVDKMKEDGGCDDCPDKDDCPERKV